MKKSLQQDHTAKSVGKATGGWGNSRHTAKSSGSHPLPGGVIASQSLPNGWKRGKK